MKAPLLATMRKEFRQMVRDRRMMVLLVGAPVIQLFVLGFAVNFDVDRIPTVVCDFDRTPESRALQNRLFADGTFSFEGIARDCTKPDEDIRDGLAKVALVIPAGFASFITTGRGQGFQFLIDGTDPVIGRFAQSAAMMSWTMVRSFMPFSMNEMPVVRIEPRILYNPAMKTAIYMVPGVSAMVLLLVTMIATSMGIARERETGTLEQVLVTPIRPYEFLLGKVMPFVIIGLFDVLLAMVVGTYIFDVPVRGSLFLLFVGTAIYLLSTVGLGMFIATISRTQQQAIMGGFFVVMPAILLSGIMTPIGNMPSWLQPITYVNPVRYFVEILRGILLRGADLIDLWRPFVALTIFGTLILMLAVKRMRKQMA